MRNKKPKYQLAIESVIIITGTIVALFSFYDGLSSAIDFITLPMSLLGTIIIIAVAIISYLIPKRFKLSFEEGRQETIIGFSKTYYLILLASILSLWIPQLFKDHKKESLTKRAKKLEAILIDGKHWETIDKYQCWKFKQDGYYDSRFCGDGRFKVDIDNNLERIILSFNSTNGNCKPFSIISFNENEFITKDSLIVKRNETK